MVFQYQTQGTCSKLIQVEINDGKLGDVRFLGGCNGNLKGIATLIKGMAIDDVIARLQGIDCNGKGTSCPDQLSQALIAYKNQQK